VTAAAAPEVLAPGPRVVLLTTADAVADARVMAHALALRWLGLEVTVLNPAPAAVTTEVDVDGVHVVGVPVPSPAADYRSRRGEAKRVRLGYLSREDMTGALRVQEGLERSAVLAAGTSALPRQIRTRWFRVRRKMVGFRSRLLSRRLRQEARVVRGHRSLWFFRLLPFLASWRRLMPEIADFELALVPQIVECRPDVIAVHDVALLPVALRAKAVTASDAPRPAIVYDARHYVAGLAEPSGRWLVALRNLERACIGDVDRVSVPSSELAARLQSDYGLPRLPDVVPDVLARPDDPPPAKQSIRELAGVATDVPLLVLAEADSVHGAQTVLAGLAQLEGAHLAVLASPRTDRGRELASLARVRGLHDRVHIIAPPAAVSAGQQMAGVNVGVVPLEDVADHALRLPSSIPGYVSAGVPVAAAGVGPATAVINELGVGATFPPDQPMALAAAVRSVLSDAETYRAHTDSDASHARFSSDDAGRARRAGYRDLVGPLTAVDAGLTSMWVGPTNSAGQGYAWAKAFERRADKATTEVWTLDRVSAFVFPSDVRVDPEAWRSHPWQIDHQRDVRRRFSHVLMESGRGVFGTLYGGLFREDVPALEVAGIRYAVVFHGSEVRSPRIHAELEPTSPFRDPDWELGRRLQEVSDRIAVQLEDFDGARFVSTPDLLDYVPDARWLPTVVDLDIWSAGPPVLERDRPVLLHVPSNPELKGTAIFDPIGQRMADEGLIEYRRAEDVPVEKMPALVNDVDMVFDQFGLGLYGVQAVQALASGRLVLSYVGDRIRSRLPVELPIVEVTPETVEAVVRGLLDDRDAARAQAAKGREFVSRFHDGAMAAEVLREWTA
jgi:hypothetical protein